jgi:hypothetical protein
MCPLLALPNPKFFLLGLFTILMRQTKQAVRAIKQSISLDVYGKLTFSQSQPSTDSIHIESLGQVISMFVDR